MITIHENIEYLHGACVEFACALHDQLGYTVEHVRRPDGTLTHAYCITHKKHLRYFVDIRGVTSNWNEFVKPYYNELKESYAQLNIEPEDYVNLYKYDEDDPHAVFKNDEFLYRKAELIICGNMDNYILK